MHKITLYHFKSPEIKITIEAYFDKGKLIVEGYDIGSGVKEWWGDSDYEYSVSIYPEEVEKVYSLFEVKKGDKSALLKAIACRFNSNSCYSDFRDFIDKNGIKSEGFSWA